MVINVMVERIEFCDRDNNRRNGYKMGEGGVVIEFFLRKWIEGIECEGYYFR